ncbi:mechanosensitive ion channel family protein [Patescibacteria group bacterium]
MLEYLNQIKMNNILENFITSTLIFIGAFIAKRIAYHVVSSAIHKIEDDDPSTDTALEQRAYTLGNVVKGALNILIYGIAFITIVSEWGIDVAPILTGAGILGLAIGFGAQSLVKDAINGFFILLENQFNVGDYVKVAGLEGKVKRLTLRNTMLKTDDGKTHTIPNSNIDIVTKIKRK